MSGLKSRRLRFGYGEQLLLDNISIHVRPGELHVVTGPNGAGKTTLLRLLSGLLTPAAGSIELDGTPLARHKRREIAQRLAVVPQELVSPFPFTVREMVSMGRAPWLGALGREAAEDRDRVEAALEELGLRKFAERRYPTLSGGEKQRVLLARARVQASDLLLLDEPTAHMDLGHKVHCFEWLRSWIDEEPERRGVLLVTHDLVLGARYADRLMLLAKASAVAQGAPLEVLTPDRIAQIYGVEARVERDADGRPLITPERSRPELGFR